MALILNRGDDVLVAPIDRSRQLFVRSDVQAIGPAAALCPEHVLVESTVSAQLLRRAISELSVKMERIKCGAVAMVETTLMTELTPRFHVCELSALCAKMIFNFASTISRRVSRSSGV